MPLPHAEAQRRGRTRPRVGLVLGAGGVLGGAWLVGRGSPRMLGKWAPHPNFWAMSVDYTSGRRVALGRAGSPPASLPDAVAASWMCCETNRSTLG